MKYSNLNIKNFEDFDYLINYYYNYINDSESNLKEYNLTEDDLKMISKIKYNIIQNVILKNGTLCHKVQNK